MNTESRKIILIGNGCVGSSYAFAITLLGIGKELGIIDTNKKKTIGDAIDLSDAVSYSSQKKIYSADYQDCSDAQIVVISAGLPQKEGQTRLELLNSNLNLIKEIVENVMLTGFNGIFLVATNPVDILTKAVYKYSGLPKNQVIGSGTVLDTARLRKELSQDLGVDARNIHAYIMGEHGDSEFAVFSQALIGPIKLREWLTDMNPNFDVDFYFNKTEIKVRNTAYDIINLKGSTYYGIARSLAKITKAILDDDNSIMTVSTLLEGEYEENDIYIGVPAVVNKYGVVKVIDMELDEIEKKKFKTSAKIIKDRLKSCNLQD